MKLLKIVCIALCLIFWFTGCKKDSARQSAPEASPAPMQDNASASASLNENESEPDEPETADFKENPCTSVEYYVAPGTSRELSFAALSPRDGSEATWEVLNNEMAPLGIEATFDAVESEAVDIGLWALEQDSEKPLLQGIYTHSHGMAFVRTDDNSYLIFVQGITLKKLNSLSESEMLDMLVRNGDFKNALDQGTLWLSRSSVEGYINTFYFTVNTPEGRGKRFLGSKKLSVQATETPENTLANTMKSRPVFSFTVQRYSHTGNFIFFGPDIEPSCLNSN